MGSIIEPRQRNPLLKLSNTFGVNSQIDPAPIKLTRHLRTLKSFLVSGYRSHITAHQ